MAELASSVASNLVSKLGEYLFAPIGRQFGYALCYNSYIQDLQNGVEKLENARERVQRSVDEAVYGGKPIHTDIEKWLDSVKNKANEAQNLLTQGESAKTACFHGWLPNPMVRLPIGRKVKKMTRVIQELHDETANNNFQKVYYENPPKGIVIATTSAARSVDKKEDVLESRASITEDVINAITDDKICVVGVYGLGGVGKPKLLEDVERRVKKEKLFDMVAMANVSRNPDLKTIQGEIADALGLNLMNVETARGRANHLRESDNKVRGCKLLLSSRKGEVLRIDMVSDREFQLKELDNREGRRLFERILGNKVYDPDFRFLVDGVVKNCGGLPLFIISLAKRLRSGNLAAWRNALTIEGSDFKSLVELNYKDLKDERIQSLFLVCTLRQGRTGDILFYCLGLGLFNNFSKTIEDARDRLSMDLDFVDVANSIASTEWKALVGRKDCGFKKWSKAELRECTAILFPNAGIDELPEKLDCPNLRIFLLYKEFLSLKVPESFFESMQKLQVLELEGISITSLPSSIEFLENLKSLSLVVCHLEDVTLLGKLKALQILHLLGSTITQLPKEIGELTELRILNLKSCTRLKVIEPGVLGSLVNLEELYMADSFDRWEAEDEALRRNASLTELKNMNKLSTLDIAIPHSAGLARDLPFGKLNKHKIQIGGFWDWSVEYKESRTLKLKLDLGNLLFKEWVQRCLQRTQHLHLDGLQDGNDSIHDLCIEGFQELKYLHVQNSPSFHYVVHPTNNVQCTAFTRLVSLFLENLGKFEKICGSCLALESFSKLKIVKVDNCSEIKHLFPSSMMRLLSQLEEIEISRCHLMQQIVADVELDKDEIYDPNVKSYNLRRLILRNLPKMTSFYKTTNLSVDFFDGQQAQIASANQLKV
ncbi:disease resistance protein At4g27190-like [Eucalyptus grandis]|uniref:disease resistance protein At4g27190-like n=1 Tax=Eucalyptus grandis TaxID=71139 RepID=UPI00192EC620|nr:disease resistance protein At4g27190-like [Eucalyptus grandis]